MKAVVFYGPKSLKLKEKEIPKIVDDEVLVKVRSIGICGSDLRIYNFGSSSVKPPIIIGHEFAGDVVIVGKNVNSVHEGDRVNVTADCFCGNCRMCISGYENLCEKPLSFGYNVDGAYAEYIKIPARFIDRNLIFKLPSDLPYDEAALVEPLACVLEGDIKASISLGKKVAIIGAGPIGLMHVMISRLLGASSVTLMGKHEKRLKLGKKLGADTTLNISYEGPSKVGAEDFDVVIVAVSNTKAIEQGIGLASRKSVVEIFGGVPKGYSVSFDPNIVHYKEVSIIGSYGYKISTYNLAFKLVSSNKVRLEKLITHKFGLKDYMKALKTAMNHEESVKVILNPL